MDTLDAIFWSTRYPDGSEFHEPGEQLTIRGARPGPSELLVNCGRPDSPDREPLVRLELGLRQPVPIFYRVHGITLDGSGDSVVLAVVFGRAGLVEAHVRAQLWMINAIPPLVVPCSPEHLDQKAVEHIAEAFA